MTEIMSRADKLAQSMGMKVRNFQELREFAQEACALAPGVAARTSIKTIIEWLGL